MKRILSLLLTILLLGTSTMNVFAGHNGNHAKVEYNYNKEISCGTVRYISQLQKGKNFKKDYWGNWAGQAIRECGTSCLSMALSYIGVNKTPKNILDYGNGRTYFRINWGDGKYLSSNLSDAISNYLNGNGKYSPVVIHLPNYSANGHFVVIIGQVEGNTYQVLDPNENKVTNITLDGYKATYSKNGKIIKDTIDAVHQWHNAKIELAKETGWVQDGNQWYYHNSNGEKAKGWLCDNGCWYYLSKDGVMQTGWVYDGSSWYYMTSWGGMKTGWLNDGGDWYYLASDGSMQTGWIQLGETWYYMNGSGIMQTGEIQIDGTPYNFNESGAWIA